MLQSLEMRKANGLTLKTFTASTTFIK